jgi:hypothetical protein
MFDLKHAARVVSRIFELKPSALDFDLDRTSQIGSWSADTVPVFLTVQFDRHAFHRVVAQLTCPTTSTTSPKTIRPPP